MTIPAAVSRLQAIAATLPGVVSAPDAPPEAFSESGMAVSYPFNGEYGVNSYDWGTGIHVLVTNIHYNRSNLGPQFTAILPVVHSFLAAIKADLTLAGSVSIVQKVEYRFGELTYNDLPTIGWQFRVTVKINE